MFRKLNFLINLILIFSIVYDVSFKVFPFLTTGRVAFLFLTVAHFSKIKDFLKNYGKFFLIVLILLVVSFFQSIFSDDFTQVSRIAFFMIYSLMASFLMYIRINNLEKLLTLFLLAFSFQSVVLLYSFFRPSFKLTLDSLIVYGGNFTAENLYRAFGFSSATGAALSVIQGLAVGVGLIKLHMFPKRKFLTITAIIICFISTFFVGRTGIIVSIIFAGYFFVISFKLRLIFKYAIMTIIALFSFSVIINQIENRLNTIEGFSTEYFSKWIAEGFDLKDNKTVNALAKDQRIPELNFDTFFIGTGTITKDGLNTSGHDSGFIQTYYSMGLFFTFVFYFALILFIYYKFRDYKKSLVFLFIFLILLLEFKEPMVFKYTEIFVLFSILFTLKDYLSNKQIMLK
ncbi:MAG: hypothetical protein CMB99_06520 [Flavobacteriaceae bacterium]|nr:hypothetical protein [Flavobacteriaceae bacterium]|tara:strand:- start:13429 stop:14628 length:1200 start_codon:yes stop_codon:yes gene_type:complete